MWNRIKVVVGLAVLGSALLLTGLSCDGPPYPPNDISPHPTLTWSPDGKHIIFSPIGLGVFVIDAAGTRLWTFPENNPLGDEYLPGNAVPALSPDGSRIAFVMLGRRHQAAIYTAALNGTALRRLTDHEGFSSNPVWSPDGSRIAYTSGDRVVHLKVMDADGSNDRILASEVSLEPYPFGRPPEWSPDGKWIAFVSQGERSDEEGFLLTLYTVRPDGSELNRIGELAQWWLDLYSNSPVESTPVLRGPPNTSIRIWAHMWRWAPDSSRIALIGASEVDDEGKQRNLLYTVRPDGSELTRVAEAHSLPVWSPDGSSLAFVGTEVGREEARHDILYTVRPDGSGLTRIADMLGTVQLYDSIDNLLGEVHASPAWSPDGEWLAFSRGVDEERSIYVARSDGTDLRKLVHGHSSPVSWSPDGTEIFFQGMEYAVLADGSGMRRMLQDQAPSLLTTWSPDGSQLAVLLGSRNGRHKLISAPQEVLYTITRDGIVKRLLVRGDPLLLVAEHSNWRDVTNDIASCADGYVVPHAETNKKLVLDCETLLAMREVLAGEGFLSWSATVPIENWRGVTVEGSPGNPSRVTNLYLTDLGLTGTVPPRLADLTALKSLNLATNALTGSIPLELANLENLEYLNLSNNNLDGTIPPELGERVNLRRLYLQGNNLTGCVPAALSDRLTELKTDGLEYCE